MTEKKRNECHVIIHKTSIAGASIAASMAQIPGTDLMPLTGIMISMTIELGIIFGLKLTESEAKSIVGSLLSPSITGRGITQFTLGWIPIIGNILNSSTAMRIITKLGWEVANNFDKDTN
jgi:Uncharacterized protein/domain associated with GTPases